MKRRTCYIAVLIMMSFLLTMVRMAYIEVVRGRELAALAAREHERGVSERRVRGDILDRYGVVLAGLKPAWWLVADRGANKQDIVDLEVRHGVAPGTYLKRFERGSREGEVTVVLDTFSLGDRLPDTGHRRDIRIIPAFTRYLDPPLATHVIGYLSQMDAAFPETFKGACGIEACYDSWLTKGNGCWQQVVSGRGRPVTGMGLTLSESQRPSVVLTLDARLQAKAEEIMHSSGIKRGAIVVLDVKTRDILTMVSYPGYDPSRLKVADTADHPFINRALNLYHPGSLFKVVVAISALENGLLKSGEQYYCPGYYRFKSGLTIGCWKKEGHGLVNVEQALALSCNTAFIEIGQKVGRARLLATAKRLHLTENRITGYNMGQKEGQVNIGGGLPALANACLGQQGVMVSPLMVADLMATIADNGWYRPPRLVLERRKGDTVVEIYRQPAAVQVMSPAVAQRMRQMLRGVVIKGTGKRAEGIWQAAGKTASSETGSDELTTWFAGYVPAASPRLVIVVLAEKGDSGGVTCAPVFRKLADEAAKLYPAN